MKFYFKTLLPYLLMLFVNFYVIKFAFEGMTAPYDLTFIAGILALTALAVADGYFIWSRLKKMIVVFKEPQPDDPTPKF